jgi:phosphoenolpyruvate synthase/pyruvate phosphate dikinase
MSKSIQERNEQKIPVVNPLISSINAAMVFLEGIFTKDTEKSRPDIRLEVFQPSEFAKFTEYVGESKTVTEYDYGPQFIPFSDLLQIKDGLHDSVGNKNVNCSILGGDPKTLPGIGKCEGLALPGELYTDFIQHNNLVAPITAILERYYRDEITADDAEKEIYAYKDSSKLSPTLLSTTEGSWNYLLPLVSDNNGNIVTPLIVRSSFTGSKVLKEDSAENAGAGRHASEVVPLENMTLEGYRNTVIDVFFSAFTARAIQDFRGTNEQGVTGKGNGLREDDDILSHLKGMMSCPVMPVVRSDMPGGASAIVFTDARGFVYINCGPFFGEELVRGDKQGHQIALFGPWLEDESVTPIVKESLGDLEDRALQNEQILLIAREAWRMHKLYATKTKGVDFEVAIGPDGVPVFVQFRPNTGDDTLDGFIKVPELTEGPKTQPFEGGQAVNSGIATGKIRYIESHDKIKQIQEGDIVIIPNAMPEWNTIYSFNPAAVITEKGGPTCHFVIENKKKCPLIVGYKGKKIDDGTFVTVYNKGKRGRIYPERLSYYIDEINLDTLPLLHKENPTKAYVIAHDPNDNFGDQKITSKGKPAATGVALLRPESQLTELQMLHPDDYLLFDQLADDWRKDLVAKQIRYLKDENGEPISARDYYVQQFSQAFAIIAATAASGSILSGNGKLAPVYVRAPEIRHDEHKPPLIRDNKGKVFESQTEHANPMMAGHGAPVYAGEHLQIFEAYIESFIIAKDQIGAKNLIPFMPFISQESEIIWLAQKLKESGIEPEYAAMIEIPSCIELIPVLAKYGFTKLSIGLNDLTQFLFGRDRGIMAQSPIDWENPTLIKTIKRILWQAKTHGCTIGFCGQLDTSDPAQNKLARILFDMGIDYMAANPDNIFELNKTIIDFQNSLSPLDKLRDKFRNVIYWERTKANSIRERHNFAKRTA